MPYLTENEVISGREGQVIANIDGQVYELAEVRKLEAKVTKKKTPFKVLGYRGEQNKSGGYSAEGSMTIYYSTSLWNKIMHEYTANGKDLYFSILVTNTDPSSSIGAQRIRLNGCNINELVVAKIDADAEFLDNDLSFTFNDYEILEGFNS